MPYPRILFVWKSSKPADGVHTVIELCRRHLPRHGITASVLAIHDQTLNTINDSNPNWTTISRRSRESDWSFERRILRCLSTFSPDIVVLSEGVHHSVSRLLPANVHTVNVCHSDTPADWYYEEVKTMAPSLSAVVGVSPRITANLKDRLKVLFSGPIVTITNGVEAPVAQVVPPAAFASPQPIRLVYVGRVRSYQKRAMDMIPFVNHLERKPLSYQLTIIGDGDAMPAIKKELADPIAAGRVIVKGQLPNQRVLENLLGQDILLLFSEFEGLPMAVLEGIMRSVVPVVTRIESGICDYFQDSLNCRLFPVGRPEVAAEIVEELASDRRMLQTLKKNALELASTLSAETMVKGYADLFTSLLVGARPALSWKSHHYRSSYIPRPNDLAWWLTPMLPLKLYRALIARCTELIRLK